MPPFICLEFCWDQRVLVRGWDGHMEELCQHKAGTHRTYVQGVSGHMGGEPRLITGP